MKYLTNRRGQKIGVVLDIRVYRNMIADIEELESIRAYDTAKISGDQHISFKEAVREIERSRKRATFQEVLCGALPRLSVRARVAH